MKFSSIICFALLSLCFIQLQASEDWYSYQPSYGYDYAAPKKQPQYDDNLYDVATAANKKQSDSIWNGKDVLYKTSVDENEAKVNKESRNLYQDDKFAESSKFKDDLFNQRNTKANERDDLDQYSDALKFAKSNKNSVDKLNKVSYNDAKDDVDQSSLDKLNENNLVKSQNSQTKSASTASHGEATDNQMNNVGLSYGGYGADEHGNAPSHQSRLQHQQQHDFTNSDASANDQYLEQGNVDKLAQINLKKRQSLTNFDKDDRLNTWNEDNIDFASKNDNLSQRRSKDYVDSATEKRNIYKDNDVDKSSQTKTNEDLFDSLARSKKFDELNQASEAYDQTHGYSEGDSRGKVITRGQGNGYGYQY